MNRRDLPFRINCEGYFLDNKGKIIAKESDGIIFFPGGGIEEEEEVINAMIRETKEETGAVVGKIRKLGVMKFVWGPTWAKTPKQKSRYQKFQGDEMHFFVGDIISFEEPITKEDDFWDGDKLIDIKQVIKKIEESAPFDDAIKEYRKAQLKFLKDITENDK